MHNISKNNYTIYPRYYIDRESGMRVDWTSFGSPLVNQFVKLLKVNNLIYELNICFSHGSCGGFRKFWFFTFLTTVSLAFICSKPNNGIRATCKKCLIHLCIYWFYDDNMYTIFHDCYVCDFVCFTCCYVYIYVCIYMFWIYDIHESCIIIWWLYNLYIYWYIHVLCLFLL